MKYPEKEKPPIKGAFIEEDTWDGDERLCPECEGRGRVQFKDKRDIAVWGEDELCMTCDGLGVVYESR
jgi:DnaJ-class molecular chaperone